MKIFFLPLLAFTAFAAWGGAPDEDAIARLYLQKFQDASPANVESVYRRKPGHDNDQMRGYWSRCNSRNMKRGSFISTLATFNFYKKTSDILTTGSGSRNPNIDFIFDGNEFQGLRSISLKQDENPEEISKSVAVYTVRAEASGDLIIEYAMVPTASSQLKGYEVLSEATTLVNRPAVVIEYISCRLQDML